MLFYSDKNNLTILPGPIEKNTKYKTANTIVK